MAMAVFSKAIQGHFEGWPLVWIMSTTADIVIPYDSGKGSQARYWCKENLNGEWIHCRHGYFAFRRKDDAMAFKITWTE